MYPWQVGDHLNQARVLQHSVFFVCFFFVKALISAVPVSSSASSAGRSNAVERGTSERRKERAAVCRDLNHSFPHFQAKPV